MKFSVITVTFQNINGLKNTAKAVLSQSFADFEWVIVDGGSTDGTLQYLEGLNHPNISWLSEPDDGIFYAMNKGIQRSRAAYCIFLNAGDLFYSQHVLRNASGRIGLFDPVIAYGDTIEENESSRLMKKARNPRLNLYSMFTHHQSIFYARRAVEKGYDTSYRFSADWALTTRLLEDDPGTILYLGEPISVFERGGVSQRAEHRQLINREHWRILRKESRVGFLKASILWLIKTRANQFRQRAPSLYDFFRFSRHL